MGQRKNLHLILTKIMTDLFGESAATQVYFQPPETIRMIYPCIVYARDTGDTQFADNNPYIHTLRYSVTVIDSDPDSEIPGKVALLPMCTYDRHFVSDNLHHDVYRIFY